MRTHVSIEFGLRVERFLTRLTQIRTFSCVYSFMDYQMLVFNKWFVTLQTCKSFFTFMVSHMSCDLRLGKEGKLTQLTGKGLMSSMEQFMSLKTWFCEECPPTWIAGKVINPWVPFLMSLEIRKCRKSLLTKRTRIRLLLWQTEHITLWSLLFLVYLTAMHQLFILHTIERRTKQPLRMVPWKGCGRKQSWNVYFKTLPNHLSEETEGNHEHVSWDSLRPQI